MAPYLDPVNRAFIDAGAKAGGPAVYELPFDKARAVLEDVQKHEQAKDIIREKIDAGSVETVLFKPSNVGHPLPLAFYFHGGGWILGSPNTHDSLVSDLVREAGVAIAFPYYTPAPDAQFPQQFEEAYAAIEHFVKHGEKYGLKTDRIVFAGDSAGGHMAVAMSALAAERKLPAVVAYQVLFYPVADTLNESETYKIFHDGPWLSVPLIRWMKDAFIPKTDDRSNNLASPVLLSKEQAAAQPPTLIITAAVDLLQKEGKNFGHLLQQAGVDVAIFEADGQIHDFAMLEPVRKSATSVASVELAALKIKKALS
ncbi:Alpha/beta hydrolase fold-3 [Macrophomina phaseolina MS6]|uniref:Alpha/beta hydrolase fold-3 n=2 Tax=Macrophomina phaseolina TaxID=35725 RepID=K2SHR6_MACPH|nr:Alpha/beta hydrolase fold-3 [Macrophomina phaseolina MS6]KAH7060664.1 Alpha/Beta hydrolase protein [Macrophomina phaseolina]